MVTSLKDQCIMAVIKHKLSKRQALPDCLAREVELRLQLLVFGGYIRSLLTRQLSEPNRRGYRISEVSFLSSRPVYLRLLQVYQMWEDFTRICSMNGWSQTSLDIEQLRCFMTQKVKQNRFIVENGVYHLFLSSA